MVDKETKNNMIMLLSCALKGNKTEIKCDEEDLFRLCQYHKVTALASTALKNPDEKWVKANVEAVRRTMIFDHERDSIINGLEKKKVWYCPLKGIVLKELYPKYGIREMSDNDILIDKSKKDTVKRIMIDNGFSFIYSGNGNHEIFHKNPVCNFEMHTDLFNELSGKGFIDYYDRVKSRLIKDNGNEYGYHFSNEDFYVYFIAHNHKHLCHRGSGIRALVDMYVYLKKNTLNMSYVIAELGKLNIAEEVLRNIAFKVFEYEQDLNEEENEMLDYILSSGVYGNQKNGILNSLNKYKKDTRHYKAYYIWRRLFLSKETLKTGFPFFYRHAWARPFLLIYRLYKAMTVSRKKVLSELKVLTQSMEKTNNS